jgi:hypothetical protein
MRMLSNVTGRMLSNVEIVQNATRTTKIVTNIIQRLPNRLHVTEYHVLRTVFHSLKDLVSHAFAGAMVSIIMNNVAERDYFSIPLQEPVTGLSTIMLVQTYINFFKRK